MSEANSNSDFAPAGRNRLRRLPQRGSYDQETIYAILDAEVSDLELGAFCVAMRVKGETVAELLGFLDAIRERLPPVPRAQVPTVVLPCYNGARRLPALTPLLALLLARQGMRVLIHGQQSAPQRVTSYAVLQTLSQRHPRLPIAFCSDAADVPDHAGVVWLDTATLLPGLQRLLDARLVIGLRNSGHSVVKLLNPAGAQAILVTSYTHPDYRDAMVAALREAGQRAMLLRGTEGEPVANPRRMPALEWVEGGHVTLLEPQQPGSLPSVPKLPDSSPQATADGIAAMLSGEFPIPSPIVRQAELVHAQCLSQTFSATPEFCP